MVDEIIVLDTGSVDNTVAIAKSKGAKVHHFTWCDDFAAARNEAFAHVTSDWVLILDADERLTLAGANALRTTVDYEDLDCVLLPRYDAPDQNHPSDTAQGLSEPIAIPRLFRRKAAPFWEGIIHEDVRRWMLESQVNMRFINAPLLHYGYTPNIWERKNKALRNRELLQRQIQTNPKSPRFRNYLAQELIRIGDIDRARSQISVGWQLLIQQLNSGETKCAAVDLTTVKTMMHIARGELDAALSCTRQCLDWGFEHPNVHLTRGSAYEQLALTERSPLQRLLLLNQARIQYTRCITMDTCVFTEQLIPGATSYAAATRLGVTLLLVKRPAEALEAFERALASRPKFQGARIGRAEALLEGGDPIAALRSCQNILSLNLPDVHLIAARALVHLGRSQEAQAHIQIIANGRWRNWESEHRRAWFRNMVEPTSVSQRLAM